MTTLTRQEIQKQLDQAYNALRNLEDRKAQGEPVKPNSLRVLHQHIRYLKQLIAEAS